MGKETPRADARSLAKIIKGKSSEEQHQLARQWAQDNGVLFDLFPFVEERGLFAFKSGNESDNWIDKQNGVIYKVNNLMHSSDKVGNLLERVKLYNQLFPETKLTFYGLATIGNESQRVLPIFTQQFIPEA